MARCEVTDGLELDRGSDVLKDEEATHDCWECGKGTEFLGEDF